MSPSRCSLRAGVTVTVSSSVAGSTDDLDRAALGAVSLRVLSAKPPARTTSVTSPASGASIVKRPSGPVNVCRSGTRRRPHDHRSAGHNAAARIVHDAGDRSTPPGQNECRDHSRPPVRADLCAPGPTSGRWPLLSQARTRPARRLRRRRSRLTDELTARPPIGRSSVSRWRDAAARVRQTLGAGRRVDGMKRAVAAAGEDQPARGREHAGRTRDAEDGGQRRRPSAPDAAQRRRVAERHAPFDRRRGSDRWPPGGRTAA